MKRKHAEQNQRTLFRVLIFIIFQCLENWRTLSEVLSLVNVFSVLRFNQKKMTRKMDININGNGSCFACERHINVARLPEWSSSWVLLQLTKLKWKMVDVSHTHTHTHTHNTARTDDGNWLIYIWLSLIIESLPLIIQLVLELLENGLEMAVVVVVVILVVFLPRLAQFTSNSSWHEICSKFFRRIVRASLHYGTHWNSQCLHL